LKNSRAHNTRRSISQILLSHFIRGRQ
jgi:hypothetical protein